MKRYIIFLCQDTRPVKEVNGVMDENAAILLNQVAKKTFKRYKVGDYLSIKLKSPERLQPSKIVPERIKYFTYEVVLCKVKKIINNVVFIDIVKE